MEEVKPTTPFLLLPLQAELVGRLRWFVQLRWIAALGVLCTVLAARYLFGFEQLEIVPLLVLVAFIAGLNLIYALHLARSFPQEEIRDEKDLKRAQVFAQAQIWFDLVLLTLMIYYAGGVENPFSFFYVFHVIISSILLTRGYAIATTFFAVALYSGMILAENYGIIPRHSLIGLDLSSRYLLGVIFAFGATMFIAALVIMSIRLHLRLRERELAEAQKAVEILEAQKSGFLRMVSHELRSPIAAIQSSLGVVMNLGAECLDDDLRASLVRATNRAEELFNLTKDLLEFSRLTTLEPASEAAMSEVEFGQLVKNAAGLYANQAKDRKINFQIDVPDQPVILTGDPRSLDQIVSNIISNAIRYTPHEGEVKVRVENLGDRARLVVSDTGIGIAPEDLNRIGTEFYRSPNAKQFEASGTGIGMRIVKEAIRQHGGNINIDSKKGKGTTFQVDIPLTVGMTAIGRFRPKQR